MGVWHIGDRIYKVATCECYPVPQQVSHLPPSEHVDADQDEKGKPSKVPSNMSDTVATPPAPEIEELLCQYDSVQEMPPLVEVEQTTAPATTVTPPSSVTPA